MRYHFKGQFLEEEDGRWSAWIDELPGCSTWGHTLEEATQALQEAALLIVEDMLASGEVVPDSALIETTDESPQSEDVDLSIGVAIG